MNKLSINNVDLINIIPYTSYVPSKFYNLDVIPIFDIKIYLVSQDDRKSHETGFFAFLDWMSEKGLMAKNTVVARKAAANKVLGTLSNEEAQDVTVLDLDTVMRRFTNLEGKGYTPGKSDDLLQSATIGARRL